MCGLHGSTKAAVLVFQSPRRAQPWKSTLRYNFGHFSLNAFRGFRGEVENVSANQRPGNKPEEQNFGREHLDVDSCQNSFNSVQQL